MDGNPSRETLRMQTSNSNSSQQVWQTPKLQELGNLRDFVRVGNANGKSGGNMDGAANCGGEAMNVSPECSGTSTPH